MAKKPKKHSKRTKEPKRDEGILLPDSRIWVLVGPDGRPSYFEAETGFAEYMSFVGIFFWETRGGGGRAEGVQGWRYVSAG